MKTKFKKCSECGRKMLVKKGGKGRFWACTGYKDGCSTTSEFHGYGPKAGLDLDIRQIENGFIIKDFYKYAESVDDEEPNEVHCSDRNDLKKKLTATMTSRIEVLLKRLEQAGDDFVDEEDDDRPVLNNQSKSKNINDLLKRVKRTRIKAASEMAADEDR
jgi:ssDNA-binding Zn-finger/Zn-ribbon topoisomerase 1